MTTKQRQSILLHRWPAACSAQHWNKNDRTLRLAVISKAVGRQVESMNDLNNASDIDAVFAYLGYLCGNVGLTVETLPSRTITVPAGPGHTVQKKDTPGLRRTLLWRIEQLGKNLGGMPYVLALARDRFHIVSGLNTIDMLPTEQLDQLRNTLVARAHRKSQAARSASLDSEEQFPDEVEFPETTAQDDSDAWWEQENLKEQEASERELAHHTDSDNEPF